MQETGALCRQEPIDTKRSTMPTVLQTAAGLISAIGIPVQLRMSAARASGRSYAMHAEAYHPGTARVSIRLMRL